MEIAWERIGWIFVGVGLGLCNYRPIIGSYSLIVGIAFLYLQIFIAFREPKISGASKRNPLQTVEQKIVNQRNEINRLAKLYNHTRRRMAVYQILCKMQNVTEEQYLSAMKTIASRVDVPPDILPCGHPRSSLYFGKFALPEGECTDCGKDYLEDIR